MKRAMTMLGTLAAAAGIAVAVPGLAHAADGWLRVSGTVYEQPQGCYDSALWPLTVENQTNVPVTIYSGAGCSGDRLNIVFPGQHAVSEFGQSVLVGEPNGG